MGRKKKTKYNKKKGVNPQAARYCKLARSLIQSYKPDQAEPLLISALALSPKDPFVLVGLGDVKRLQKDFSAAISYYKRCLIYDPENRFALSGLGDAHRGNKDLKSAIEVWSQALEIHPDNFQMITRLADALVKTSRFDTARDLYLRALQINPNDCFALSGLGNLYVRQRKFDKACPLLEKLVQTQRNNPRALGALANFYRKQERYTKASGLFEKILKTDPFNVYALDGAADCARGKEEYGHATAMWKRALDAGMNPVVAKTRIADGYVKLGRLNRARTYYKDVLSKEENKFALFGQIRLIESEPASEEKKLKNAAKIFNRLFALSSGDTRIRYEYNTFKARHPQIASFIQP